MLGGAPLNAAVQAHQIGRFLGGYAVMASRIGGDELGQALVDTLQTRSMDTTPLQRDPEAPGTVKVTLRGTEPEYEIIEDVAWDRLDWDDTLERLAKRAMRSVSARLASVSNPPGPLSSDSSRLLAKRHDCSTSICGNTTFQWMYLRLASPPHPSSR